MASLPKNERLNNQVSKHLNLQELNVREMKNNLDPNGWMIKNTEQFLEPGGTCVSLVNQKDETVAAVVVSPAEKSQFKALTKLSEEALENSISIHSVWIAPHVKPVNEILPAILYLALRRGRIWQRQSVVALIPISDSASPIATLLRLEPMNKLSSITTKQGAYLPVAQHIPYAIHNAYQQCAGEPLHVIQSQFVNEILETVERWLSGFNKTSWAQAIFNGTLAKQQYIWSLFNLYQYVRQTTRILGRCIFHSDNIELRNHYIHHLKGEINHELIIERDLEHLGADIDYLKRVHVPSAATKQFMSVQESTLAFYEDSVLMFACPLAAEGVASHIKPEFMEILYQVIASWGVKDPKKAARFIGSHIKTDGGNDGHWMHVVNMLGKFIENEQRLQQFLNVLAVAMVGFENGFNANVDHFKLWEASPQE